MLCILLVLVVLFFCYQPAEEQCFGTTTWSVCQPLPLLSSFWFSTQWTWQQVASIHLLDWWLAWLTSGRSDKWNSCAWKTVMTLYRFVCTNYLHYVWAHASTCRLLWTFGGFIKSMIQKLKGSQDPCWYCQKWSVELRVQVLQTYWKVKTICHWRTECYWCLLVK